MIKHMKSSNFTSDSINVSDIFYLEKKESHFLVESKETSQHFLELRRGEMKIINNSVTSVFSLPSLSKRGEGACEGGKWSGLDQDPHQGGVEGRRMFVCP